MKLKRIVIAGNNPTNCLRTQLKIKEALKKIGTLAKSLVGNKIEFGYSLAAELVNPTSCDLLLVVGPDNERSRKTVVAYRSLNNKGDARIVNPGSRYCIAEQIYVAYLAWKLKQEKVVRVAA